MKNKKKKKKTIKVYFLKEIRKKYTEMSPSMPSGKHSGHVYTDGEREKQNTQIYKYIKLYLFINIKWEK